MKAYFGKKTLGASSRTNNVNKIDVAYFILSPVSLHTWLSYECCSSGLFIYSFLHFNCIIEAEMGYKTFKFSSER